MFHYFRGPVELPIVGGFLGMGGQELFWAHHFEVPESGIGGEIQAVRPLIGMSTADRAKFRIPMNSLNVAQDMIRRGDVYHLGRGAVELGTALEALLSNKTEDNDALTYKVKMRGSAWLKGSDGEKAENMRIVAALYKMRSKVVHGGAIQMTAARHGCRPQPAPVKIGAAELPVSEFMRRSKDIVVRTFGALLTLGKIPDWDCYLLTGNNEWPS
jgi:hypothetical protein